MLSTPEAKERIKFLTSFGLRLPKNRDDGPQIYDFIRGKAPSDFGALFQWLKEKFPPQSYADVATVIAGMQRFYPDFVPTIQLRSFSGKQWETEETKEACLYLHAALERGVKFDVRCELNHLPEALIQELCGVLANRMCSIEKLELASKLGARALPDSEKLGAAIAANTSIKELQCPLDASLLNGIGQGAPSLKRLCIDAGTQKNPAPLAHEYLCNILSKGGITLAGITGFFEHPHSYDFAKTVATANLHGGKVETVTIEALDDHTSTSSEAKEQCMLARRTALTLLLESKVIKHLAVPISWFGDIDELTKLVQNSWLLSLDVPRCDSTRIPVSFEEKFESYLVNLSFGRAQSLVRQSMEKARPWGAGVGFIAAHTEGLAIQEVGPFFANSINEKDARALACVSQATASYSRQRLEIIKSMQVGRRLPVEAPAKPDET